MANKAMVLGGIGPYLNGSTWSLTADVRVQSDDAGSLDAIQVTAEATSFNPLLPDWRARLRTAIIAYADTYLSLTVDEVLFPDFSTL